MSSNMRILKICEYCKNEFIAKKTFKNSFRRFTFDGNLVVIKLLLVNHIILFIVLFTLKKQRRINRALKKSYRRYNRQSPSVSCSKINKGFVYIKIRLE